MLNLLNHFNPLEFSCKSCSFSCKSGYFLTHVPNFNLTLSFHKSYLIHVAVTRNQCIVKYSLTFYENYLLTVTYTVSKQNSIKRELILLVFLVTKGILNPLILTKLLFFGYNIFKSLTRKLNPHLS